MSANTSSTAEAADKPILPDNESVTTKHTFRGLDHLRAFAISYVVLFHYQIFRHPHWVKGAGSFGWTGVDLFFVLSGFLIAGQLFSTIAKGKTISMKAFFIKRFFRIIPPFLVVVIIYSIFPFTREREQFAPVWRYLTFTQNFGFDLKIYGTFSHAWSLCVEEQFYLILPVCFWLFSYFKAGKKAGYLLLALFIAGFGIRLWSWYHLVAPRLASDDFWLYWNEYIYYPTYNRLDGLLAGVGIAGLFTFHPAIKERINRFSNIWLVTGLIILIAAWFLCTPSQQTFSASIFGFPVVALGYGLVVAAAVCPNCILYKFKSTVTSQLATLSYAIYLTHKMVIHVAQNLFYRFGVDKSGNLMMLICLICVLLGAIVMRFVVEKPSLRLRDRILNRV
jgi:peptidoglycan/LPS O-acetylase OafA/YrhL